MQRKRRDSQHGTDAGETRFGRNTSQILIWKVPGALIRCGICWDIQELIKAGKSRLWGRHGDAVRRNLYV